MREPLKITPQKRLYRRFGFAFTSPGGFRVIGLDVHDTTDNARAFRKLRTDLGLSLMAVSRAFGLRPSEVSGLEHGRFTCDWSEAESRLRALAASGEAVRRVPWGERHG